MFAPAAFELNGREYLTQANELTVVIVQIESRIAVENCEEIASVPGIGKSTHLRQVQVNINKTAMVDMLFIGPNDLAASMGYFAFDHAQIQEVQDASRRVLKAARAAGKYAGHFALTAATGMRKGKIEYCPSLTDETAAEKYQEGFDFVNCGADIVAITAWMSKEISGLKRLDQHDGGSDS